MTPDECEKRVRLCAARAGMHVYFLLPGQLEGAAPLSAVFTVEDFDSDLVEFDPQADAEAIAAGVERARRALAERCGCEIVHVGAGRFRCLRHDLECETGEEQDPVIRQTLRWTAYCPGGDVCWTFQLNSRP